MAHRDLSGGSFLIPIQATNAEATGGGEIGFIPTGIILPANSRYVLSVSGTVQVSAASVPCEFNSFGYVGEYGPNGINDGGFHQLEVSVALQGPLSTSIVTHPTNKGTPGPTSIYTDTLSSFGGGEILVARGGIAGGTNCGQAGVSYPAYNLSSSQIVSVVLTYVPPPPPMTIGASTRYAGVGDTVSYGAGVAPPGGSLSISRWRWVPDTGYSAPPGAIEKLSDAQCGTQTACNHTPLVPGTMWVIGAVNGNPDSASVHVNVVPCATPIATRDTILDHPLVRKLLRQAWDSSHYTDPITSNRRERGGYVWRLPDGTYQVNIYAASGDTPCTTARTPPSPFPGVPIAAFHVHPFKHLEILPSNCPIQNRNPALSYGYDALKYGGPSGDDFGRLKGDNDYFNSLIGAPPFQGYVMDDKNIYRFPPTTTTSNWKTNVVTYPRNDAVHGCVRP